MNMKFKIILNHLVSILFVKGKMSLGRILLMSVFMLSMIKWSCNIEIVPSMLTVLLALLAYNLGSKFINKDKSIYNSKVNDNETKEVKIEKGE